MQQQMYCAMEKTFENSSKIHCKLYFHPYTFWLRYNLIYTSYIRNIHYHTLDMDKMIILKTKLGISLAKNDYIHREDHNTVNIEAL